MINFPDPCSTGTDVEDAVVTYCSESSYVSIHGDGASLCNTALYIILIILNQLTTRSTVLGKLRVAQRRKNSPSFEERQGSLPRPQKHITCPFHESDESNPIRIPTPHRLKIQRILSSHLCLRLPSGLFLSGFLAKILHAYLFFFFLVLCHACYMLIPSS